jgi:hypothetical protein
MFAIKNFASLFMQHIIAIGSIRNLDFEQSLKEIHSFAPSFNLRRAVGFRYGNFTLKLAHGKKSLASRGPTALGRQAFLPVG